MDKCNHHILLVNPTINSSMEKLHENGDRITTSRYQSLGIAYIGSMLEKQGYIVTVIDKEVISQSNKELIAFIEDNNVTALGVSLYYYNILDASRLISRVKSKFPNIFLFVGGYLSTFEYRDVLTNHSGIDCCITFDGEDTSTQLLNRYYKGEDWRITPGIACRSDTGEVQINRKSEHRLDLDTFPFPKRTFFHKQNGFTYASIITSRGCYGKCTFCTAANYFDIHNGRKILFRSAPNVVGELKELSEKHNVNYITIYDDCFVSKSPQRKKWIRDFCSLIKDEDLRFKFYIYTRADSIVGNEDTFNLLKSVGLESVFIGIESFIPRQLELYGKSTSPEMNKESIRVLRSLGIKSNVGFIYLDPFCTKKEIQENIEALIRLEVYNNFSTEQIPFSCISPLFPTPNSKIYELFSEKKLLNQNCITMYDFEDEGVQLFTNIISSWRNPVYQYFIESNQAHPHESFLHVNLLKFDLEFLEETINKIITDEVNQENYHEYILQQTNMLHEKIRKLKGENCA